MNFAAVWRFITVTSLAFRNRPATGIATALESMYAVLWHSATRIHPQHSKICSYSDFSKSFSGCFLRLGQLTDGGCRVDRRDLPSGWIGFWQICQRGSARCVGAAVIVLMHQFCCAGFRAYCWHLDPRIRHDCQARSPSPNPHLWGASRITKIAALGSQLLGRAY